MKNTRKLYFLITTILLCITGCAQTPEESAVVSKKDGLDEAVIDKPLKEGELRTLDIPTKWTMEEKREDFHTITVSIDLELDIPQVSNLPVVEFEKADMDAKQEALLNAYFQENGAVDSVTEKRERQFFYEGAAVVDQEMIGFYQELGQTGLKTSGGQDYGEQLLKIENKIKEEPTFTMEDGLTKVQAILKELNLEDGYAFESYDKVVTFGTGKLFNELQAEDLFMEAEELSVGYEYKFTKSLVDGLPLNYERDKNGVPEESFETKYSPAFPVEVIIITITQDGLVRFQWNNISKQTEVISENTKLMDTKKLFKKLADNLYYSNMQDIGGTTPLQYNHKVTKAELGYSYVPAFNRPQNVWAVPTWFFEVEYVRIDPSGSFEPIVRPVQKVMLSALDGGYISDNIYE